MDASRPPPNGITALNALLGSAPNLRHLTLSGWLVGDDGDARIDASLLPKLRSLTVSPRWLRPPPLETFSLADMPALESLKIEAVRAYAELGGVASGGVHLKRLSLARTRISPANMEALARGAFTSLEELDLSGVELVPEDAEVLERGHFPKLRTIKVHGNGRLAPAGVRALAGLPAVTTIVVGCNEYKSQTQELLDALKGGSRSGVQVVAAELDECRPQRYPDWRTPPASL